MTLRIGLDTNALLRWLFREDREPDQYALAGSVVFDAESEIWINGFVVAELIWLASQKLRMDRPEQGAMIRRLLEHPKVVIADKVTVEQTLAAFELGGAGFVDHMIGALITAAGCKTTLTFDKSVAKGPHFTQLV